MSKFIRNLIIIVLGLGLAAAVFLTFQPEKNDEQNSETNNYGQDNQESYEIEKVTIEPEQNKDQNIEPKYYEEGSEEPYQAGDITMHKYKNADLGLSFNYRKDPDGYTLIEQKEHNSLVLMPTEAYEEILGLSGGAEWPPGISIVIHDNTDNISPTTWVQTHTRESNYDPAWSWSLREITVGGAPAVTYETDGLYAAAVVAVSHNRKIYAIHGNYHSPEDQIVKDFEKFLESLLFF
ncbi:MAG: hypothetical protein M3M85_02545 [bacterium]|nr:hypothetical protein [bacterium]